MIWSVAEQISFLSSFFEFALGDVILTGTPEGVGPVERGQALEASVEGLGTIRVRIA